jgi:leader peptidase (prepilin peptidase)/N-methyltransferase
MLVEWWYSPLALGILGLCIGSFLNVVVYRLPKILVRQWSAEAAEILTSRDEVASTGAIGATEAKLLGDRTQALLDGLQKLPRYGLALPRSACPACGHQLAWHENLPLLGWLRLRGRCSACGTAISARYPLVELITGLLFAAVAWLVGPQPMALLWCGFVAVLLAASFIDWDTTLLPDVLTLNLMWVGLVAALLGWTIPVADALWGTVAAALALGGISKGWKLLRGVEGMAMGDVKLLAALGAWLGWQMLLPIVLGASAIGALVGIGMKATGALREGRYVPFGPFLAGAALVVMFAGKARVLGWLGWA